MFGSGLGVGQEVRRPALCSPPPLYPVRRVRAVILTPLQGSRPKPRNFHWNSRLRIVIDPFKGRHSLVSRSAMTRAEEYRRRAKEAEEQAHKTRNRSTKQ